MIRRPPVSTRTDTLFPYTTRFRSRQIGVETQIEPLVMLDQGDVGAFASRRARSVAGHLAFADAEPPSGESGLEVGDGLFEPGRGRSLARSEGRRVGKECVSTCRSRGSPHD